MNPVVHFEMPYDDQARMVMPQVARAGGEVLGEPVQIPGIGGYVSFMDTEGNRVSMLQPLPRGTASS